MRIPEQRLCDLCRAPLTARHVRIAYPLDAADVASLNASLPQPPGMFREMFSVTPVAWNFEFCTGCAEGFMPMLAELKTQAIKAWLADRARRAETPIGPVED